MYLAQEIEYSVQTGRALSILFECLFPLTGFGATDSGVDCRNLCIIIIAPTLMFVALGPSVVVSGFRSAGVTGTVTATG